MVVICGLLNWALSLTADHEVLMFSKPNAAQRAACRALRHNGDLRRHANLKRQ